MAWVLVGWAFGVPVLVALVAVVVVRSRPVVADDMLAVAAHNDAEVARVRRRAELPPASVVSEPMVASLDEVYRVAAAGRD